MKAILLKEFGDTDQLYLGDAPRPDISKYQVLIRVEAVALNRADILQRKGLYPPPNGASEILGLEISGEVIEADQSANDLIGTRVMALLSGGGYAEYVAVHKSLVLKVPDNLDSYEAAGLMEAFLTGWQALSWLGKLKEHETVLIHAGASGVGTACIQLAKNMGATIFTTASPGKHQICKKLGADYCIDYHQQKFEEVVQQQTTGGVDLVIDFVGTSYFKQNLSSLNIDGRMVMLGFLGGSKPESLNLAPIIFKRLTIMGSTLRSRSLEYRGRLVEDFKNHCYEELSSGRLKPVIDRMFSWEDVKAAHQYMEQNKNRGKLILKVDSAK